MIFQANLYSEQVQLFLNQLFLKLSEHHNHCELKNNQSDIIFDLQDHWATINRDNQFQLLSDDGSIERKEGTPCKDIKDKDHPQKYFRSLWIRAENS